MSAPTKHLRSAPSSAPSSAPGLPLDPWLPDVAMLRDVPAPFDSWLRETGLLTARISAATGRPCVVRVVAQRSDFLSGEQQALLQAPAGTCFVREIELCDGATPWVYAQTLVPDATLELHPWLAELGEASLGETLAAIADLERGPTEYAALPALHPLTQSALRAVAAEPEFVWARRWWVAIRGARLLVHEVFLPGIGP
jgi:chorismate lyase